MKNFLLVVSRVVVEFFEAYTKATQPFYMCTLLPIDRCALISKLEYFNFKIKKSSEDFIMVQRVNLLSKKRIQQWIIKGCRC